MNSGKLYVAQFNNDGTGKWIELAYGKNGLNDTNTVYPFKSQADVTTFARLAGDAVKATKMDRPEWVAVNPENGEVYVTLTNNSNRGTTHALDAANPRNYSDPEGDGMWFDPRGVLWIQTDDGAYTDTTNCMMLAALPGKVGDGAKAITSAGQETIVGKQVTDENLRRFLTGPKQCEITGVTMTGLQSDFHQCSTSW
ncbi:hypothetical protein FQR65_LT18927 [Abscondita terminalis]|nr:hypothetical protein FQR65_LT18927 [Abscondita terminalis]